MMFAAILAVRPVRVARVSLVPCWRFLGASDAAADIPSRPSGGFLLHLLPGECLAAEVHLTADVRAQLDPGDQKIAQRELIQILAALLIYPDCFRGRRGLWFIDNVSALIALVKGRSGIQDLDHLTSHLDVLRARGE
jgi:hypothetical protein